MKKLGTKSYHDDKNINIDYDDKMRKPKVRNKTHGVNIRRYNYLSIIKKMARYRNEIDKNIIRIQNKYRQWEKALYKIHAKPKDTGPLDSAI